MTEPLEDLIQRAWASGVTMISLDHNRCGVWRRSVAGSPGKYLIAWNDDPVEALRAALNKALAVPAKPVTNLNDLLG